MPDGRISQEPYMTFIQGDGKDKAGNVMVDADISCGVFDAEVNECNDCLIAGSIADFYESTITVIRCHCKNCHDETGDGWREFEDETELCDHIEKALKI